MTASEKVQVWLGRSDSPRWEAELSYTTDDDGVWVTLGPDRVCLGHGATLREAFVEAGKMELWQAEQREKEGATDDRQD